ncbi:YkgJ family cysteine cluster protein [Candidatus Woesearchaeota archaeon]|nr:YkgJ family cysteine cluster protein [Candidatus Woesearchaeota archaeon]
MITCDKCDGNCCQLLVVEIETPETRDDFEDIKWYLFHKGVTVYIDKDDLWNVQFDSKCKHLTKDGRCKIYKKRPPVCREYHVKDCDMNNADIKEFFGTVKEYEAWLRKNKKFE